MSFAPRLIARLAAAGLGLAATAAVAQERQPVAQAMGQVARQLFDLRPVPSRLDLPPFRTVDNGLGDCDEELRDRLIEALRIEQADPTNAVVERRIDVRLPAARSDEGGARIAGRYGADGAGRVWTEVQVLAPDRTVLAALPRSYVTGLVCRGLRRSLADSVDFATRPGRGSALALTLARPEPRIGDLVSVTLRSESPEPKRVLCLNVAASDTAQVLTPLRPGAPTLPPRGTLAWPRDFTASGGPAGPICFEREQADAFLCVAVPAPLAPALERRWAAAWPEGRDEPEELSPETAMELVGEAAAAPGAAVALQRYQVRRGQAGGLSACGAPIPR